MYICITINEKLEIMNKIYTNTNEARYEIVKTKEQNDFVENFIKKELEKIEVYTTKDVERATQRALIKLINK